MVKTNLTNNQIMDLALDAIEINPSSWNKQDSQQMAIVKAK